MISRAAAVTIGSSVFDPGAVHHRFSNDADAHPRERARRAGRPRMTRVRRAQHRRARDRRVGIPRVVVAVDGILQRVQHLRAIGERAAEDAAAIAVDVGADRATVEPEHRLVRKNQRHRVVIGRAATRCAGLLAEAGHHEIGTDRHARPRARAQRGRARRVIRICRIAAPRAALVAQGRRQHVVGRVAAARIAGAPVVFGIDRLGEDDRALVAELLDQHVIARREIDVVARVAAGRGAHVLRVERILEREHDAVHRHRLEIGIASIRGVELGGALERVGQPAEHLAHRRRARRQWPRRRMPVEISPAGHGSLTANVERRRAHSPVRHSACRRPFRIAAVRTGRTPSPPCARIRVPAPGTCGDRAAPPTP